MQVIKLFIIFYVKKVSTYRIAFLQDRIAHDESFDLNCTVSVLDQSEYELSATQPHRQSRPDADGLHRLTFLPFVCGGAVHGGLHSVEVSYLLPWIVKKGQGYSEYICFMLWKYLVLPVLQFKAVRSLWALPGSWNPLPHHHQLDWLYSEPSRISLGLVDIWKRAEKWTLLLFGYPHHHVSPFQCSTTVFLRRALSHFLFLLLSESSLIFSGKSLRDGKSSSELYDSRL